MATVVSLFRNYEDANRAVKALEEAGFKRDSFSVLARNSIVDESDTGGDAKEVAGSVGVGALGGGVVGGLLGLLAGVGAIAIPGIGPAIAVGAFSAVLGTTVGAASVGAAVGGILGAMTKLSVTEEDAHLYAEGVKRGGVLITVETEGEAATTAAATAQDIMKKAGAVDLGELRTQLQQTGWERFNESDNSTSNSESGNRPANG
jgi:uncharacterized membrane protein